MLKIKNNSIFSLLILGAYFIQTLITVALKLWRARRPPGLCYQDYNLVALQWAQESAFKRLP